MPSCYVTNCKTGTFAHVKRLKDTGSRNISCYNLPKDENLRRKWLETLNINIRQNESGEIRPRVCELHFRRSDIIRYNVIKTANGDIIKYELERTRLQPNALPLAVPRPMKFRRLKTITGEYEPQPVVAEQSPEHSTHSTEDLPNVTNTDAEYDASMNGIDDTSENDNPSDVTTPTIETLENLTESQAENADDQSESVGGISLEQLGLDSLILPINWARTVEKDGCPSFTYIHPYHRVVYMSCIINKDMSVDAVATNKNVRRKCDVELSSAETVLWCLRELQRLKCCEGSGVNNIFTTNCQGFLETNSYRLSRCKSCKDERNALLRKQRNNAKHLEDFRKKSGQILSLTRKNCVLEQIVNSLEKTNETPEEKQ